MKFARFSLRDVFWLTLVICLALGWWLEQPSRRQSLGWFTTSLHAKVYYVEDLLEHQPNGQGGITPRLDGLAKDIQSDIAQGDWELTGGAATIKAFETNCSLVVRQSDKGHALVAEYLTRRREQTAASNSRIK